MLFLIFLPDSIAVFVTMGQAQQIDSIKFVVESSTEFNVDDYGSITIPMGTFDALRVKMDDIQLIILYTVLILFWESIVVATLCLLPFLLLKLR